MRFVRIGHEIHQIELQIGPYYIRITFEFSIEDFVAGLISIENETTLYGQIGYKFVADDKAAAQFTFLEYFVDRVVVILA